MIDWVLTADLAHAV